jgi:predicted secreted protein with PEFG-CTERM motif
MIGTIIVQEVHADDNAEAEEAAAAEAAAAEAAAAEAAAALVAEEAAANVELMVMISDSQVMGGTQIELEFSELHVNYDLTATQNGEVVFEETGLHSMENIATHQIDAVGSDENPIDVEVVSLGIGAPGNSDDWTGPIGQVTTAQVVPEFGTIAMMVLAVAIISIVAVTAKSRVVPRF